VETTAPEEVTVLMGKLTEENEGMAGEAGSRQRKIEEQRFFRGSTEEQTG